MSTRKQVFAPSEFYHLYNRGTDKKIIFKDEEDYCHFLFLMYVCNTQKSIEIRNVTKNFDRGEILANIGAYCLMPNHFHILICENTEGGISKYMLKLQTAYSMYFNKKYERTGTLYEGTFKSTHLNSDKYVKYIYSYIHLNPVKLIDKDWKEKKKSDTTTLLKYALSYPYSSIVEYLNISYKIINPPPFPAYFQKPLDHKNELFEWLNF